MKKLPVLISGLILFSFCFSQNVKLEGVIFDAVTNQPLQYATIEIFSLRTGTITNKKPGNDLLLENVVISAKKPGWCEVDISQFNVLFPKDGAFVMMEWVNSGEGFYFEKEFEVKGKNGEPGKIEKKKYYGQTLGTVSKKGGVAMWGNTLGNEWIPYDFDKRGNYVNAMIQVEIAFEKN